MQHVKMSSPYTYLINCKSEVNLRLCSKLDIIFQICIVITSTHNAIYQCNEKCNKTTATANSKFLWGSIKLMCVYRERKIQSGIALCRSNGSTNSSKAFTMRLLVFQKG